MSHNWTTKKLEDIVERVCVGFVGSCNSAYVTDGNGIPMIRTTNITESGLSFENLKFVTKEFHEKNKKSQLKKGDLLIARHGDSGLPSIYMRDKEANCLNAVMVKVYPNEQFADNLFLLYSFKNSYIRNQIKATVSGSVQGVVNTKTIAQLNIPYPDREIRMKIVNILSTLDDKIELNRKMNKTLEEIAQAIFKSWFVDFDPVHAKAKSSNDEELETAAYALGISKEILELFPSEFEESELGMIPKGWSIKPLSSIAHYQNGLALQKFRPLDETKYLPVLKIAQLNKGYTDGIEKADINIKEECIVNSGDVIFSWSGTLVVDIWCGGKAALNQHLFKVTSKDFPKWFYYYWTKQHLYWFQHIAASKAVTMGHIKRSHLDEALCCIPNESVFAKAENLIGRLVEKTISNRLEIQTLQKTRDTLLPKLLSGELDVSELELDME